jgi:outer membrane protein OmpA-like peptidoglycan-associated protein
VRPRSITLPLVALLALASGTATADAALPVEQRAAHQRSWDERCVAILQAAAREAAISEPAFARGAVSIPSEGPRYELYSLDAESYTAQTNRDGYYLDQPSQWKREAGEGFTTGAATLLAYRRNIGHRGQLNALGPSKRVALFERVFRQAIDRCLENALQFAPGEIALPPDALPILDDLAWAIYVKDHIRLLELRGSGDRGLARAAGEQQGLARAEAVRQYLVAHRVPRDRLVTRGQPFDAGGERAGGRVDVTILRQEM